MFGVAVDNQSKRFRTLFDADIEAKPAASDISSSGIKPIKGGFEAWALCGTIHCWESTGTALRRRRGRISRRYLSNWYEGLSGRLESRHEDEKMGNNRYIAEPACVLKEKASLR